MVEHRLQGPYLLIDAAGPAAVAGLMADGDWIDFDISEINFLEWMEPTVKKLLNRAGIMFGELNGIIYGSGPGSTLGLRLAAMFIRTLLEIPELRNLNCLEYRNLEFAICEMGGIFDSGKDTVIAPWRRDLFHRASYDSGSGKFTHGSILPEKAVQQKIQGIRLGKRHPDSNYDIVWNNYPGEKLPIVLNRFPQLLHPTRHPKPYSCEDPAFRKWEPTRHSAK